MSSGTQTRGMKRKTRSQTALQVPGEKKNDMAKNKEKASGFPSVEKGQRIIAKKTMKKPRRPVRPPSAFFIFCKYHKASVRDTTPGISNSEIVKTLKVRWTLQNKASKGLYESLAIEEKIKYHQAWVKFYQNGGLPAVKKNQKKIRQLNIGAPMKQSKIGKHETGSVETPQMVLPKSPVASTSARCEIVQKSAHLSQENQKGFPQKLLRRPIMPKMPVMPLPPKSAFGFFLDDD